MWKTKEKIFYILYAISAKWLPEYRHLKLAKYLRAFWARRIIHSMGSNVNVEHGAFFTPEVCIGNDAGISTNCELNGPVTIGSNVMMGPECVFYTRNHKQMCIRDRTLPELLCPRLPLLLAPE